MAKELRPRLELRIVTRNESSQTPPIRRLVLNDLPINQLRSIIISIEIQIPIVHSVQKPCWNFQKANWDSYKRQFHDCIRWIKPIAKDYD